MVSATLKVSAVSGINDYLRDSFFISDIEKYYSSVITPSVNPAAKFDLIVEVCFT
jgi:hypothetical protein